MNNVLYLYLIIYKDLWTSILIVTLILKKRCICDFSCNRMIVLTTKEYACELSETVERL